MAVTKIRKISSWTLLISSIISIIVLGMFYAGGVVDPAAEMKEPIYTGLLINWTSVLFFVTVFFVAVLFITYTMGDATPLTGLNADSQVYNTPGWLKITDMWIMSTIVLLVLIVACVVWGSVKRIMGK